MPSYCKGYIIIMPSKPGHYIDIALTIWNIRYVTLWIPLILGVKV